MSYIKYGVPNPPQTQPGEGSRLYQAFAVLAPQVPKTVRAPTEPDLPEERQLESRVYWVVAAGGTVFGVADLALIFTLDTAGAAFPLGRVTQGRDAHFPEQGKLESRLFRPASLRPGTAELALTFTLDTAGTGRPLARVVLGREAPGYDQRLLESRLYRPAGYRSGVADLALVFTLDTTGVASSGAVLPKLHRALLRPENPELEQVSRTFAAFAATGGYAPVSTPVPIIPGSTNQGGKLKGVEQEPPESVLLESRTFFYLHTAPPIYRVIIPGGTNQGFQFQPLVQPAVEAFGPSRRFKGYAPTAVFGAADLALTFLLDSTATARPLARVVRGLDPHFLERGRLDSRVFRPATLRHGAADLALTFALDSTGRVVARGSADLALAFLLAASVASGFTLVVVTEDGTLTLTPLTGDISESLTVHVEDNTLTLTVLPEFSG